MGGVPAQAIPVLRELFEDIGGVERLLIYGSWAERRAGECATFPNDIDVLVVGDPPRRTLTRIPSDASDELDVPVNITRLLVED